MESRPILQIVSGFKPSTDGMGDFSRLLGHALWQQNHLRSHFLVYRRPAAPFEQAEIVPNTLSYPAEPTPAALRQHLAELLPKQPFHFALVHYGPYGYSSKGHPAAFVEVLEELAAKMPLLVFFHELFSAGKPWQRAFWTNSEQKRTMARLLRLSTAAFTSNSRYRERLEEFNPSHRPLTTIPIFSNIGEPANLRPLDQRARQLIIFGQATTRTRLYRERLATLEGICRSLQVEKVIDVGAGQTPFMPLTLANAPVQSSGYMEELQLSALMADSIAGVLGYWPDVWEKSGVMASYAAHALLPILVELEPRRVPKPSVVPYLLPEEVPALLTPDGALFSTKLQAAACAAHTYYQQHQSVNRCAQVIAKFSTQAASL